MSNCLVDVMVKDYILFYYGDIENLICCLNSEYCIVGLRFWKFCLYGFYEIILGFIDIIDGIEIHCMK